MILGFKERFKQPILEGTKIHTIREDKGNRWSERQMIHCSTGVRTKKYNCFCAKVCTGIQTIRIEHNKSTLFDAVTVYIDGDIINHFKQLQLAKNDGFNSLTEFYKWFNKDFEGKIIHWTDFRY